MNWDSQNGSNGKRSGGPWEQGGGTGGQNQSLDLEDILRRGQEQLKGMFPDGSSNGLIAIVVALVLLLGWIGKSVYQVAPEERGVEFMFGKPTEQVSSPGLHFVAWPIETVELANIEQRRDVVGVYNSERIRGASVRGNTLMLSGDQNIVDVEFTILWRVSDPVAFIVNVKSPQDLLHRVSESAMREYVARSRAEDVRTEKRQELERAVRIQIQTILNRYHMGIDIDSVQLERADPPSDVADAFEEVQRAQQDQEKYKQEAMGYANKLLGNVRGQASKIRESAKGYMNRVVAEAEGEAHRFLSVYGEYTKAKDVTRKRLFLETMEEVLGGANKFIIEDGVSGSGVIPYLPLHELQKTELQK